MSENERFIKFIPSEEAFWLMHHKPNAFRLLTHIANTARWKNGGPDGLSIGQCHLKAHKYYDLSYQECRTAKDILVMRKHIIIIETNRTRKKSTTGLTTDSTLVQLISSTVYDINNENDNHRINHRATTDQPLTNHKQEGRRKKKNEKEDHPSIPSFGSDRTTDDFSSKVEIISGIYLTPAEIDTCIKLKGSIEVVRESIAFIQASKRRKHEISDWPNALANWKIENKAKVRIEDNIAFATKICKKFEEFTNGWRCSTYHDKKKDQKGLLFESESHYVNPEFVAFSDGIFAEKVSKLLESKNMEIK